MLRNDALPRSVIGGYAGILHRIQAGTVDLGVYSECHFR
jgi:hypothetical protein